MAEAGLCRPADVGRSVIVKDEVTTPIQSEAFIYEMTAHAEIRADHSIRMTKCSHPELRGCFPQDVVGGPLTIAHGEAVARWCVGSPAPGGADARRAAARDVLTLARQNGVGDGVPDSDMAALVEGWLREQGLLGATDSLREATAETLTRIARDVRERMKKA
jgi:hypothetical protein